MPNAATVAGAPPTETEVDLVARLTAGDGDALSHWFHTYQDRVYAFVPAQAYVLKYLKTFAEFPRRAEPATFGLEQVMQKIEKNATQ